MRYITNIKTKLTVVLGLLIMVSACEDKLDEPLENVKPTEEIDYTKSEDMIQLLYGAYAELNFLQWETYPIISVRGDDVNAAGDQFPLTETDEFRYDRNFWMYNSSWLNLYNDVFLFNGLIEGVEFYKESGANAADADQYIAEIKVMRGFELLQLARLWGAILVPETSVPAELVDAELFSFEETLQFISTQMDEAIPNLPAVRPNQRTDIEGGITRYTALAVKAMVNLELKNFQAAADATGEIIGSGLFTLDSDFYQLFKIPGKLSDESLMELQYSDFGTGSGTSIRYLWNFFGPADFTPAVDGAGGGWGFWEPSEKYVKFMLDRGEQSRLVTSVLFTPAGMSSIQADPQYATLPSYISNVSPDGDTFNDHPRYKFLSGKHYLPTTQLTPGRTEYGENNNFRVIRYAEVLLMHAEALANGANSSVMSADDAVNQVRNRAGLASISGVTLDNVLDEKYAEFGMEWGIRFYDLARYGRTSELNYGGRTYGADDRFIPYPLEQVDLLPQLNGE